MQLPIALQKHVINIVFSSDFQLVPKGPPCHPKLQDLECYGL
jgi:hypothetical protein